MAQVVEHILGKDEVTGSSPVSSSKIPFTYVDGIFYSTIKQVVPEPRHQKATKKPQSLMYQALRSGATGRTRTDDLLITNELLYQLSHSSIYDFQQEIF